MNTQQAAFRIDELDCAEEVLQLRRELERVPAIAQLDFDILNRRMTVTFDADALLPAQITTHVARIGMHARPWHDERGDTASWWPRRGRLVLTSVSGLLALLGFCSHALTTGSVIAALGYGAEAAMHPVPIISRLLYSVSILAGIWLVAPRAWAALCRLRADMNLLMCLAVVGAIALDQWLEAAAVTFLFSLALLLEHWSVGRARRAVRALMDLSPATARCLSSGDGSIEEKRVAEVCVGETIVVRPGERIALDGVVAKGTSAVNQAPITGESLPVTRRVGEEVYAGTINGNGALQVTVTRPADRTTLARIIEMVQQAQARRAPTEQWVERFARCYTPAMIILALAVAVGPPLLLSASWTAWAYNGLVLLVIACPCALVISTPVSIVSALTAAARHGVLVKGGRFLEAAANLRAIALDKTGTLTHGQPVVHEVIPLNGHSRRELLQRAVTMESHSTHPIAQAIRQCAHSEDVQAEPVEKYHLLSGRGAEAEFGGKMYWIGSDRLMRQRLQDTRAVAQETARLADAGHSVVAVGNDQHVCGLISVADAVRDEARQAVTAARRLGVRRVSMLTGDNQRTARAVADAVGVDDFTAESLPEDKVRYVEQLRQQFGAVAMIGDGVNDSPAMAASSLGIAMGAIGTDTAIETADVALMADDLAKVPWLIAHARRTLAVIKQNIALALGLKLLFIILAMAGAASLWLAIAADMGASLLVIFNGLRLLRA